MLVFTSFPTHRKFSIDDAKMKYLIRLLESDVNNSIYYLFDKQCKLNYIECNTIAQAISNPLNNAKIWDFRTNDSVIPILNPSPDDLNESMDPISKENKWFLNRLVEFFSDSKSVTINHE